MQNLLNLKKQFLRKIFLCLSLLLSLGHSLSCEKELTPPQEKIYKVGVLEDPPFVMLQNGKWNGVSVDIWELVADNLGIKFQYVPLETNDIVTALQMLQHKEFDVMLGSVGPTVEQYKKDRFDKTIQYSRPYFVDTIGVLEEKSLPNFIITFLQTVAVSVGFWIVILAGIFSLYVLILWFWERESIYEMPTLQKPPENVWEVLKYAIWKQISKGHSGVPKTIWGKISLLGWVSSSYIIMLLLSSSVISFMTASVRDYRGSITSMAQLENEPTVSIEGRIQTIMAQEQGLRPEKVNTFEDGVKSLKDHQVKAMIVTGAHADYYLREFGIRGIYLTPYAIRYILYSFAFPEGSPLAANVNQTLNDFHRSGATQGICRNYLSRMQIGCL